MDSDPFKCFTRDTTSTTKIPVVIDDMENSFANTFSSFPDRFVVFENGNVVHIGTTIMASGGNLVPDQVLEYLDSRFLNNNK